MEYISLFIRLALVITLTGAFVFVCIIFTRIIMERLLSDKLIKMHNAIKPFFELPAEPTKLEKSFWDLLSTWILVILSIGIGIFMNELIQTFLDLIRSI